MTWMESLPIELRFPSYDNCGVAGKSPWNTRIHPFPPMNQRENMLNWVKRSGPYKLYTVLDDAGERGNSLAGSQPLQLFATQWDSFKSKPFFTFSMISHGWIGWSWGSADWIRPYMRAIILSSAQEESWHTQTIPDDGSIWLKNATIMPAALLMKATTIMIMWKWFSCQRISV